MVLITFNLAQGKYQNLLGKIINRRAITLFVFVVQGHG
jgi:HAE1 family hydrophobic/amphiphilic exporter-1